MLRNRTTMRNLGSALLATTVLVMLGGSVTHADFNFGEPTNLGPQINTSRDEAGPSPSSDGLELYFTRATGNNGEIWLARRDRPDSEWGPPSRLGPPLVSGVDGDGSPFIMPDGLSLYFDSGRLNGQGSYDLWVTTRATVNDNWNSVVNLGSAVNSASEDWGPSLTADGLELYFTSNRPGGQGSWDLWVTTRATVHEDWGTPVNLGATINSTREDNWPGISPDGLVLFFGSNRSGGVAGSWDIYMARRATRIAPWGAPVNVGPLVNSSFFEVGTRVSPDGSTLYFQSPRVGGFGATDLWQTPIVPVLDFNGDAKIDAGDMALLAANWGKNQPLCDIGPFPWGDGVVDEKDLKILMAPFVAPAPHASNVPCDVTLRWMSPASTPTCDVYFGTVAPLVGAASRIAPLGVLVSQGQTATTYTPTGLLEFSRTYYWRVDFVIPDPAPVIYRGPVFEFTTAAAVYPIKNIAVKASTASPGSGPEKMVDGSGLDKNDGHSTDQKDMWWSLPVPPHWIRYEFDRVYALHELWVWNFNMMIESFMGFGAKTVKIEYSTDGTTWTPLADVPEFAKASGKPGCLVGTKIGFGGVSAKYVKLTIEKNWGTTAQTGLSEVRFFATQSAAAPKP